MSGFALTQNGIQQERGTALRETKQSRRAQMIQKIKENFEKKLFFDVFGCFLASQGPGTLQFEVLVKFRVKMMG